MSLLEALRAQGINVIYSSDLVPSDLLAPELPDNLPMFERAEKALAAHPAAYPEVLMTSSAKGTGIAELRATIAGLAAERR